MIVLRLKTALSHRIDLMVSPEDGSANLCFQFVTNEGLSPVFSIPLQDMPFEALNQIDAMASHLNRCSGRQTLASFVDFDEADSPQVA